MNDNKTLDKKRPIQGARRADEGRGAAARRWCSRHNRFAALRGHHPALRATLSHATRGRRGKYWKVSMLIKCPYCGARPSEEFTYLGDASVIRPTSNDPASMSRWF